MKTQGCFENMCGLMAAAATAARWITVVVLCVPIRCAVGLRGACFHRQRGELVAYFCKAHTARRTCPIYVSLLSGFALVRHSDRSSMPSQGVLSTSNAGQLEACSRSHCLQHLS